MYIWVTAQKMKFSKFPVDLVTFTEEILNENFIFCAVGHFGCSRTIRLLSFFSSWYFYQVYCLYFVAKSYVHGKVLCMTRKFIVKQIKVLIKLTVKIYLFKVDNRNTRKKFEICSKLTKNQ